MPNTGWYEATDKEIIPKFHEFYFAPVAVFGWPMVDLAISILLTVFLWRLMTKGYRQWKARGRPDKYEITPVVSFRHPRLEFCNAKLWGRKLSGVFFCRIYFYGLKKGDKIK